MRPSFAPGPPKRARRPRRSVPRQRNRPWPARARQRPPRPRPTSARPPISLSSGKRSPTCVASSIRRSRPGPPRRPSRHSLRRGPTEPTPASTGCCAAAPPIPRAAGPRPPRRPTRGTAAVVAEAEPDPAVRRLVDAVTRLAEHTRDRRPTGTTHDDADDTAGTVDTDDAVGFDPFPLLDALHRTGAEAVVIGQVAGILHGSRELTGDLDLLWDGAPAQAHAIARAFASTGAVLTD